MRTQSFVTLLFCLPLPLFLGGCLVSRGNQTAARFGPVREQVLPFSVPCEQHWLQFRNHAILVVGHGPDTSEEEFARDWRKVEVEGGVDLQAHGGKSGISQIIGKGCLFKPIPGGLSWETITAMEVLTIMRPVRFVVELKAGEYHSPFAAATGGATGVLQPGANDLPATYLFKTVRGEIGIMEVLRVVEERGSFPGMRLRYKLVQGR